MKLTFKNIKYKNIMSVGAAPIEIDLTSKKLLITGKNGGGKSTMLEALCFALFGKPFRSIKKGQLVNSINKKALLVELDFSDGKHDYHIKRGIKPNVFEITRNGEEIKEAASVKDFQAFFETDILKMNMQSFKQTIILGTAGYVPFMQLKAPERRSLIEDLINLSIYSKMDKVNKEVVKGIKQQMDALEIKLTGLRNEHDAHMQHINKQKSMSDEFIGQLRETHQTHVDKAKELNAEVLEAGKKLAEIVVGEDFSANLSKCLQATSAIQAKVGSVQTNINFFNSNTICPTCKQDITDDHKHYAVGELQHQVDELNAKLTNVRQTETQYKEMQEKFLTATTELRKLQSEIQGKKFLLQQEVAGAKIAQKRIAEAESKVDIDTTRVDELVEEIEVLRKEKTDLFEEMYARKIVVNLLKDSGIKSVVMNRYIPVINKKINNYLKILGADYTFTLDNEFNEVIKSRGREDFSYMSFSQGEKARIDLALLFTWRDIASIVSGTEINLLILDEVFDSATDGEGVEAIHTILEQIKSNVIVISHREEHDVSRFTRHIKMVKKGRFTTME